MTIRKLDSTRQKQDRPSKYLLLSLLNKRGPQTVAMLAKMACLSPRCVRGHLEQLRIYGEAFRVEDTKPIVWANKPMTADELPVIPTEAEEVSYDRTTRRDAKRKDDSFSLPVIKRHIPAGQWSLDHPVAPSSVFSFGGAHA